MPNDGVSIIVGRASANLVAVTKEHRASVFIGCERYRVSREHIRTIQTKGNLAIALCLTLRAIHRS